MQKLSFGHFDGFLELDCRSGTLNYGGGFQVVELVSPQHSRAMCGSFDPSSLIRVSSAGFPSCSPLPLLISEGQVAESPSLVSSALAPPWGSLHSFSRVGSSRS
ncbi:hypothetical protein ACLOJK_019458 [Asimina triloba]